MNKAKKTKRINSVYAPYSQTPDFGGAHRIVCREVGDWCECMEAV